MRHYNVNRENFQHDGNHVPQGETVELSDDQAKPLLAIGAVEPRDTEGFTPAESPDGVIEAEQAVDSATSERAETLRLANEAAAAAKATAKKRGK